MPEAVTVLDPRADKRTVSQAETTDTKTLASGSLGAAALEEKLAGYLSSEINKASAEKPKDPAPIVIMPAPQQQQQGGGASPLTLISILLGVAGVGFTVISVLGKGKKK